MELHFCIFLRPPDQVGFCIRVARPTRTPRSKSSFVFSSSSSAAVQFRTWGRRNTAENRRASLSPEIRTNRLLHPREMSCPFRKDSKRDSKSNRRIWNLSRCKTCEEFNKAKKVANSFFRDLLTKVSSCLRLEIENCRKSIVSSVF